MTCFLPSERRSAIFCCCAFSKLTWRIYTGLVMPQAGDSLSCTHEHIGCPLPPCIRSHLDPQGSLRLRELRKPCKSGREKPAEERPVLSLGAFPSLEPRQNRCLPLIAFQWKAILCLVSRASARGSSFISERPLPARKANSSSAMMPPQELRNTHSFLLN